MGQQHVTKKHQSLRHGTPSGKVREHGHTCHNNARGDETGLPAFKDDPSALAL